jgi:DNA ligase 1
MQGFAGLIDRLVYTPSRNRKLDALADYFRDTPDPDRGYALAALTDGLFVRLPLRRILAQLLEPHVDPVLYRLSRDYVGDTAETVALLWPEARGETPAAPPPRLAEAVEAIAAAGRLDAARVIAGFLDRLDADGRFALLKLMTGALRTGVSARLAKTGLARWSGRDVTEIEEHWHGLEPPYLTLFAWLEGRGPPPDTGGGPRLRPFMLAHPIEDRRLVHARSGGVRRRMEVGRHPGPVGRRRGRNAPVLARRRRRVGGLPRSRRGLHQSRRGRRRRAAGGARRRGHAVQRSPAAAQPQDGDGAHAGAASGALRLYDLLVGDGEDLRPCPSSSAARRLESWHADVQPPRSDLSELIAFHSFEELDALWAGARARQLEGLMLKRRSSPYVAGRTRGHWFKWKRDPLTLDCVLMYAQRGSGKRSSYYSDYTFGPVARRRAGAGRQVLFRLHRRGAAAPRPLHPRPHRRSASGRCAQVEPRLVLEVAFDAVQPSTRHKSGSPCASPASHRIRWDKPAGEADRLETLAALVEK